MTARRERDRLKVELTVSTWLHKHPGRYWRITEIADACQLPNAAVNNALRGMYLRGAVDREERKKRINGKKYPVYQIAIYRAPAEAPDWLCPRLPDFSQEQIKGLHTVLGFTGNQHVKKVVTGCSGDNIERS